MKAQFIGGPYDGVVLHLPDVQEEIILPVTVKLAVWAGDREAPAQVKYRVIDVDDIQARYEFEAIRL